MQSDIIKSGFGHMFNLFNDDESSSNGIRSFKFNESDIVRSEILKFIIARLSKQ
jgi:hypothetical protein